MGQRITQAQARETGKAMGMIVRYSAQWSEWRTAFAYGEGTDAEREASACYADTAEDALDNAAAMRLRRSGPAAQLDAALEWQATRRPAPWAGRR